MKEFKYILLVGVVLLFSQCSKKSSEVISKVPTPTDNSFRSSAPMPGKPRNVELGDYSSFDLANGLKVIVVENHKLPRVSYQLSLLNDPIIEGEKAGYVSMAGQLLKSGTQNRSKAEIDEAIDFYGASFSTSSGGMFISSLKKHSDKVMQVFTDVLYNPTFPQSEFDKAMKQTISGLASQKTDPNSIMSNVASTVMYGKNHPYGEVQTEQTAKNISVEDCKQYYETYFKPNNAYLIIVGDTDVNEAKVNAEKYFGSWKGGEVPSPDYETPKAPEESKVVFANKDGAVQSVIRVTYPVDLKPGDDDLLKASAMNQILGGGVFSGRLMQNLREDKAYTYGARSSLNSDRLVGSFSAGASVRNEVTDSSVYEILYELSRMKNEAVAAEDLQLIKNSMAGSFARSLESPQTIARFASNTYRYNLPKDYYKTYLSRLASITPEDITTMANKYIKPDNAYIIVVGNKDEVADKLVQFDANNKIDFYGVYGEPVNYDAIDLPDGVTAITVMKDYLEAIGGELKVKDVKSMISKGEMDLMGQKASITTKHKLPNMLLNKMELNGTVMQEMKVDGMKASMSGMGQSQVFEKGSDEYNQVAKDTEIFQQLALFANPENIQLKGIEEFAGEKCYKVLIKNEDTSETQFYSVKNSLMRGSIESDGTGESPRVVTTIFSDYKEVDGILMPHTVKVEGAAPFPLEMKYYSYEFNSDISDSEFKVN